MWDETAGAALRSAQDALQAIDIIYRRRVEVTDRGMTQNHEPNGFEKAHSLIEPLLSTNDQQTVISADGHAASAALNRQLFMQQCPKTVIDAETHALIQTLRLHEAVDQTASATGSAVLLRSLIQPCTDLALIRAKQAALEEIASGDTLRQTLQDYVHEYAGGEGALFRFFNKGLYALFPYLDLKRARKAAAAITKRITTLPAAESPYLAALISHLRSFRGSPIDRMMTGPIYKTFGGLQADREVGFLTPRQKFVPRRFTKWMLAGPAVALTPLIQKHLALGPPLSPLVLHIGLVWTGAYAFYSMCIKPVRDTGNFIEPLRARCVGDHGFSRAIDAVGMIDELLSCHRFAQKLPHATTLPIVTNESRHAFEAAGLKNPVLAAQDEKFVPNDIRLHETGLTFISGPNSGGKTTICKSIVHNQILAQIGSYVTAESATVNIADQIRYQAPKFDGLQDDEGRFGTELSRTRDIFYATSPKSLVILDELAEGTTYEERQRESYGILNDFNTIGNNTILVTHNHSLVDRFMAEGKGQSLMVAFDGSDPTYRIVPGISRVSHADRIVKKIRFSEDDRHRYMKEKGYL